jgi:hypothetical protein
MNAKSICSILGVIGTYAISTNSNVGRLIGFTLYIITNMYWITHWKQLNEKVVMCQYIIYTILAINGIYNVLCGC